MLLRGIVLSLGLQKISGKEVIPLVDGGKGISISTGETCGAWAAEGGVGTFSAVNADSYDENGRNTSIESYVWNNEKWILDSVERYDYAETATCMNNINSMVAKSSVKKVIDNGHINIHVDGKSFNLNGIED